MIEQILIGAVSAMSSLLIASGIHSKSRHNMTARYIQSIEDKAKLTVQFHQFKSKLVTLESQMDEQNHRHKEQIDNLTSERNEALHQRDKQQEYGWNQEAIVEAHLENEKLLSAEIEGKSEVIENLQLELGEVKANYVQMAESANTEIARLNEANKQYQAALNDAVQKNQALIEMLDKPR